MDLKSLLYTLLKNAWTKVATVVYYSVILNKAVKVCIPLAQLENCINIQDWNYDISQTSQLVSFHIALKHTKGDILLQF